MTLRAALVFVWLASAACNFGSPSPGARDAAVGETDAGACAEGEACDDMKPCTAYDVCAAGVCRGAATRTCPGCASTCDATCGGASCCAQSCPGGTCPPCPPGCSCDLACGEERPCDATCGPGAICNVSGTNLDETDGDYNLTCAPGSICSLDCVGDEGACSVTCNGTAKCLLDCRHKQDDLELCNISNCTGPVITCTGAFAGVKVCNRPCPT